MNLSGKNWHLKKRSDKTDSSALNIGTQRARHGLAAAVAVFSFIFSLKSFQFLADLHCNFKKIMAEIWNYRCNHLVFSNTSHQ